MSNKGSKSEYQKVARERIAYLLAQIGATKDKEFGRNCAKLIRALCLRYNIRLTKEQKSTFCKHCFSVFRLEKPKIRIKTIKKAGKEYIQKKIICSICNKETTFNFLKK